MSKPPTKPRTRRGPLWYRRWSTYRRLTAIAFLALLYSGTTGAFERYFRGSTSGTKILEVVPLTDPLAAIELSLASREFQTTALLGAAILVGFAIVMGPVFCGWVCPLGLTLDLNHAARRFIRKHVLKRRRLEPVPKPVSSETKYALLGVLIGFAFIAGFPLFQIISPINLLVRAIVFGSLLGLAAVGVIVAMEWVWPRLWCRALCPLGSFYDLVGRFGLFRIQINPAEAGKVPCKQCATRCPMGVPIMDEYTMKGARSVTHPDCTRCGDCTEVCPRGVLKLSLFPFPRKAAPATSCNPHEGDCECGDIPLPVMPGASG
ncbi:MAG: 4Fe-4S binding protein [Phycisphaeraceae bacterium]|nr:MAG: 4Fe-4S binding protein [Phycisphaeraceae bacterium]